MLCTSRTLPRYVTSIVTQVTNRMNKMDKDTTQEKPEVIRAYSSMEENVPPATNGIINSSMGDLTSRNHSSRFENSSESGSNSDGVEKKPNYHQTLSTDDDIAANGGSISSTSQSSTSLIKLSFYLLLGGTILGLILPQNPNLPSPTWQILSNIVGYTYFLAWSASFYPQIFLNYQRQTTRGLSVDFCVLNVLGYICYTIYTTNFYWNEAVIRAYKDRIPAGDNNENDMEDGTDAVSGRSITVQGNDVAFAIHAILMASITLSQIGLYDTFVVRPPSRRVNFVLVATITFVIFYLISTKLIQGQVDVLDFLYLLGAIKVGVTIGKYVPQALLNRSRKSTVGWVCSKLLILHTFALYRNLHIMYTILLMLCFHLMVQTARMFGMLYWI